MTKLLLATICAFSFSFAHAIDSTPTAPFKIIHAAELNTMVKSKQKDLFVYDANNQDIRKTYGVVPIAKLLASAETYDTKTVLPANKNAKLVFYCANTQCMASHDAAKRAASAGYTDVNVMGDGIQGWTKAGYTVTK